MSSILVDCILCTQSFPALRCNWDREKTHVYTAYKLFWAHKYYSHYKEICEHFIMPLYTLIFLTEWKCMFEEAFKVIEEHGSYYLTEEGMYIRMYGCSRAPSLLPKYATDYVVHKEAVRQVYLDGVGSLLIEHKKEDYPAIPFWMGCRNFQRSNKLLNLYKSWSIFHFGEINFHRNC